MLGWAEGVETSICPTPSASSRPPSSVQHVPPLDRLTNNAISPTGALALELRCTGSACCILTRSGQVRCEAPRSPGRAEADEWPPLRSVTRATHLASGAEHFCVIEAGRALCWGEASLQRLGTGAGRAVETPRRIDAIGEVRTAVALRRATCALDRGGDVWCWGLASLGATADRSKLASGQRTNLESFSRTTWAPQRVLSGATDLVGGFDWACARRSLEWYCWGYLPRDFTGVSAADPQRLSGERWESVTEPRRASESDVNLWLSGGDSSGYNRIGDRRCVISVDRSVECVERRIFASCAVRAAGSDCVLRRVAMPPDVVGASVGESHACAWRSTGELFCWGDNTFEQLSEPPGTTPDVPRPVLRSPSETAGR